MNRWTKFILVTVLFVSGGVKAEGWGEQGTEAGLHKAVTPVVRSNDWWMPRHEDNKARIKEGGVDLLMIGDSITHSWERAGLYAWELFYADRNAVNLGFSGDKTENVLWRLEDIDFSTIKPRLAVLMIGTNNSNGGYTTGQIADGIVAITRSLRQELPETRVLILNIFPRGTGNKDVRKAMGESIEIGPQWVFVNEASEMAAKQVVDGEWVHFLDINDRFLDLDGVLERDIMPDFLHLSEKGYALWASAMEPTIRTLMGD